MLEGNHLFIPSPSTTFGVKVHVGARDISIFLLFIDDDNWESVAY